MKRGFLLCVLSAISAATSAQAAECPVTLVNEGKGGGYQNDALKMGL